MSTVDIVIPCYNYARYLRGCVHSVLAQSGVEVRVLVIDDASSDDTAQVGQELATSNSRVEFRRHEVNKGHIATYNEGLMDWSTAEYTVLLSADDMLVPGSLSRAVGIMDADKNIGMVYGRAIHFHQETELPRIGTRKYAYTRFLGAEWLEGRCRAGHNVITSPEVVVRGSVQRAVGGYRPELPHVADFEMWLRIAAVSNIAYVRGVPQALPGPSCKHDAYKVPKQSDRLAPTQSCLRRILPATSRRRRRQPPARFGQTGPCARSAVGRMQGLRPERPGRIPRERVGGIRHDSLSRNNLSTRICGPSSPATARSCFMQPHPTICINGAGP